MRRNTEVVERKHEEPSVQKEPRRMMWPDEGTPPLKKLEREEKRNMASEMAEV